MNIKEDIDCKIYVFYYGQTHIFWELVNNIVGDNMSIWSLNSKNRSYQTLEKDLEVDILIIGAGITGMNTAYFLRNEKSVCVVDANLVGHGITLNTTAKINYFQQCIYSQIKKDANEKMAQIYLKLQKEAIEDLKNIINTEKISCNFKQVPSYVFANSEQEVKSLLEEVKFLKDNGCQVFEDTLPVHTSCYKSYKVNDTYIFHPLKYLNKLYEILKDRIPIYEKTKITSIKKISHGYLCCTDNYQIKAQKVILACHYPFFLFPMLMPLRCSLEKSYIIVSKVEKDGNFTCITTNNPVYSCRFYNTGKKVYQLSVAKSSDLSNNQNDVYFFKRVKDIFGLRDKDIVLKYTNCDILTPDHMPYIGKIKDNLYIGVGYNTWGMTNGILAAKLLAKEVVEGKNDYQEIFNPNRFRKANIYKFPKYIWNNTKTYLGTKLNKNKSWYANNVLFVKRGGVSLGIYKDDLGKEHIVYNKCPHLGCSLIFNETEKTWDCPCHSSRYSIDGECIKGPSNYDISYKENN